MFMKESQFLVTSRHIKFETVDMLKNQKVSTIILALKHVLDTYKAKASWYTLYLVMVNLLLFKIV